MKALKELSQDSTHVILTAYKVMALILVKEECIKKVESLIEQGGTYRPTTVNPTKRQKNKLIITLNKIKAEGSDK